MPCIAVIQQWPYRHTGNIHAIRDHGVLTAPDRRYFPAFTLNRQKTKMTKKHYRWFIQNDRQFWFCPWKGGKRMKEGKVWNGIGKRKEKEKWKYMWSLPSASDNIRQCTWDIHLRLCSVSCLLEFPWLAYANTTSYSTVICLFAVFDN